jgi:hypothetical protein
VGFFLLPPPPPTIDSFLDSDYTGHLQALLHNTGQDSIVLPRGEAFVQLIVIPYNGGALTGEARGIATRIERGIWGFGSTSALSSNSATSVRGPAAAAAATETSGTSAPAALLSLDSGLNGSSAGGGGEMGD